MIYFIIPILLLFVIASYAELKNNLKKDIYEIDDMKNTFIFKHPCGEVVGDNGRAKLFSQKEAEEYANNHPYHYVKNCYDNEWKFAFTYFNLSKSF